MTLLQFYQQHFGADPYALIDAAHNDLANIARTAGIDWDNVVNDIQLSGTNGDASKFSKYTCHAPDTIDKSFRGRCDLYSRIETRNGIDYPFINFVTKGHDGGVWSGLDFLWSEYRRVSELSGPAGPLSEKELSRLAKAKKRQAERERKARETRLAKKQNRENALMGWLSFNQAFQNGIKEDGSWPYAVKKGISDVFSFCDVRRVIIHDQLKWARGPSQYMAIPLSHLDGRLESEINKRPVPRLAGWQRIDIKGNKFQTNAVDGGDFTGACFVIGDLKGAQKIATAEGFATGASVWLATRKLPPEKRFDAVVIAISANNMINIVEQLVNMYPAAQITCILDNDRKKSAEGKGNTGLRTGYDIMVKFSGVKCVYPKFEDDPSLECNDFNDLHSLRGLKEVARQLFSRENRLNTSTNLLSLTLNRLKTLKRDNRRMFAKELLRAVDIGMLTCPVPNSPKELTRLFSATLREMGIAEIYNSTVKDHITRRLNRKCRAAQTSRSFSERITNPNLRPSHITYKRFETSRMTDEVLNYVSQLQGIVIVRAGMGSGKSTGLLRPLMLQSSRGVSVAHRVSLIGGLHEMMTEGMGGKADILHYQDPGYQEMAPYASKLTICINSIVKGYWQPLMRQHDFFGFDEATQGLRAILAGRAMENPVGVFNTLIDALARTEEHAIMVDADANDLLVDLAELAMKRREEMGLPAWRQIHVIELPVDVRNRDTNQPIRVLYTEKNRIMTEVIEAVKRDERIMLATDSSTFAEDVTMQLKMMFPGKKFLCVNQKSKQEKEVDDFTSKPKEMVKKYDGLIYSPSISSGVSFEEKHFDRHFGMFCGEVVPSDAIQMLRRDRTAQEFIIGFDKLRGKCETDPQKIKRAHAQALLETAAQTGMLTDVIFDGDRISLGVADSAFMQLKIKAAALEASARNDYASNMICIMHDDGYKVSPMATDALANSIGKDLRKEAREVVFEQLIERHISVETPERDEYETLLKKRTLSLDEQAKIVRWDIENELQLDVDEQALKFYFDGGLKKVRLFETLQLDELTAHRMDREEAQVNFIYSWQVNGRWQQFVTAAMTREQADERFRAKYPGIADVRVKSTPAVETGMRGFYTLKSAALRQYFQDCGIDPKTLEGEADMDSLKRARDNLLTHERRDLLNNVLRIGGFNTEKGKIKKPEDLCVGIMESMGLASKTRRSRDGDKRPTIRYIDQASAEFMMAIVAKRREEGLSLHARKVDSIASEVDRDQDHSLYIDLHLRSTNDITTDTSPSVITEALEAIPVDIPEAWAETVLPATEMEAVRLWPIASIAKTFAALYMTEFMDQLSAIEFSLLTAFLKRPNVEGGTSGYDAQEVLCG